jgi:hypothetical protein
MRLVRAGAIFDAELLLLRLRDRAVVVAPRQRQRRVGDARLGRFARRLLTIHLLWVPRQTVGSHPTNCHVRNRDNGRSRGMNPEG